MAASFLWKFDFFLRWILVWILNCLINGVGLHVDCNFCWLFSSILLEICGLMCLLDFRVLLFLLIYWGEKDFCSVHLSNRKVCGFRKESNFGILCSRLAEKTISSCLFLAKDWLWFCLFDFFFFFNLFCFNWVSAFSCTNSFV